MKLLSLLLSCTLLLSSQAYANEDWSDCEAEQLIGLILIPTITFAPTGTSFLTTGSAQCQKDLVINLKNDAFVYKFSGEKSPLLNQFIEQAQVQAPNMTEAQIVQKISGIE